MSEEPREDHLTLVAEEVLRRRAESLAQEEAEEEIDDSLGLLLFRLGEEWYSVKVDDVREIYQEYTVTLVPCVPSFIRGVVNIRGEIISVTDVASMMSLAATGTADTGAPVIVIQNAECTTAMVVDEIGDIADVPVDMIDPPLSVIDKAQAEYVAGSTYVGDLLVALVEVDRILKPIDAEHR